MREFLKTYVTYFKLKLETKFPAYLEAKNFVLKYFVSLLRFRFQIMDVYHN